MFSHSELLLHGFFSKSNSLPLVCSPTQQVYCVDTFEWKLICDLSPGNRLRTQDGYVTISSIKLEQRKIKLLSIEVNDTHSYVVGDNRIVVHNISIPLALTLGWSIPFSIGEGAAAGIVFGPPGIACGVIIGGVIGFVLKQYCKGTIKNYSFCCNIGAVKKRLIHAQEITEIKPPLIVPEIVSEEKKQNDVETKPVTVEEILENSTPCKKISNRDQQYEKPGGYEQAVRDFESLNPSNIRKIANGNKGFIGDLPDGRSINVRISSSVDRPTLEIQNVQKNRSTKIRYT